MRKRMNMVIAAIVITVVFVATACQPQSNTSTNGASGSVETVKIGAIYPMTGAAAQTGKEYIDAIQLAVDIINNKYDLDLPFARGEGIPVWVAKKLKLSLPTIRLLQK